MGEGEGVLIVGEEQDEADEAWWKQPRWDEKDEMVRDGREELVEMVSR